ncbi:MULTISPECIES: AbrB/MazE/SpoVT family DNA-binding domain-containing protein [Kaistia]|jgi:putative addiction module antidote|uniref:AbrB/MazE/SpoVT family DNA-binding domain-containing protein n=1 Tax=Kaistia TaxID=166953 RepID=UPI0022504BA2|nr:AbrB/MazE/SpoVT family DNA-binding domain-containing protein [Kaistia defluvii]MCX5517556.1 AbrB family transcriptional regulator [Kaistia defluvii]
MKLEIKKIGNSTGLILPKELLTRLDLQQGQWLSVTENADGSIRLSPFDPEFDKAMRIVDDVMDEYRDTLRELAK